MVHCANKAKLIQMDDSKYIILFNAAVLKYISKTNYYMKSKICISVEYN